ncbi:MAG: replication-associated recombination protein A, partial [Psychroflexus sp.]|nr:replication-associated recombination protein A [Psychroflexus sp.]
PTQLMKDLDYGKSYPYAHDYDGNFAFHDFMPKEISSENLYTTSDNSREKQNKDFLNKRWKGKYEF